MDKASHGKSFNVALWRLHDWVYTGMLIDSGLGMHEICMNSIPTCLLFGAISSCHVVEWYWFRDGSFNVTSRNSHVNNCNILSKKLGREWNLLVESMSGT